MAAYLQSTSGWCSTFRARLTFTRLPSTTFASTISSARVQMTKMNTQWRLRKWSSSLSLSLTSKGKLSNLSIRHMSSLQSILNSHHFVPNWPVLHKSKLMQGLLSKKHLSKCTYSLENKACLAVNLCSCPVVTSMEMLLPERPKQKTFSFLPTLNDG